MNDKQFNYDETPDGLCFEAYKLLKVILPLGQCQNISCRGLLIAGSSQICCILCTRSGELVKLDLRNGFISYQQTLWKLSLNRMSFKNFTLYTWNSLTYCLPSSESTAGGAECWLGGSATTLGVSVGWTVDWRLGGFSPIMSTSVSLAGICSGVGASCRDATCLVFTFGIATSFMCIMFSL